MSRRLIAIVAVLGLSLASTGAPAAGKRLARIDADGDGKITLQEFVAARDRTFDRIDADHDGQLTAAEVAAFRDRIERAAAGAMIRTGKAHNGHGGGQLKRMAKLTEGGPLTRAQWEAAMTREFRRKDTAGLGYLTLDQLKHHPAAPPPAMAPHA